MRIAIVQFPGSNCERETMLAVKRAGMQAIEFLWNEPKERLQEMDGYVIVGGFSYEDRSRAGIIAALDPVMQEIKIQSTYGKPVLGICNGAQILVETGLVPGLENNKIGMVLTENKRMAQGKILGTGFYNAWVNLRLADNYQRNAFTRCFTPKDILHVPIAHAEGRFVMTPTLLQEIKNHGLHVFQYCDAQGAIIDEFPVNPNGSLENIAAISNKAGNVMAIMPHPERTLQGNPIFLSMRDYIKEGYREKTTSLDYYPRRTKMPSYQKSPNSYECVIDMVITDNHALTVQTTLNKLGIPVIVKRHVHWEIQSDQAEILTQIKKSGVLYNDRKEVDVSSPKHAATITNQPAKTSAALLVRAKEDLLGQQKLQTLREHFALTNLDAIRHGVLWRFTCENANIQDYIDKILQTNILFNSYGHDCYHYE